VWYNKLSGIQEDIKMLMFKKKKIQVYLNNVGDPKTALDLLLCDYLNGSIKKDFESIGFEKISINIDWLDDYKCIGIQCKYQRYYVDIQIHNDEFSVSYDLDEPDEDIFYKLDSREQFYQALEDMLKTIG
jgi:hypothetical protein